LSLIIVSAMINAIHKQRFVVCQWTGESFPEPQRFLVPDHPKVRGQRSWTGCYGSPGAAVSGIKERSEKLGLSVDQIHELIDEFETSLSRKPGKGAVKFTIVAAPDYKNLSAFGGPQGLEDFHKLYNHDAQIEIYEQHIPNAPFCDSVQTFDGPAEKTPPAKPKSMAERWAEAEYESDPERPANAPKRWHVTPVGFGRKDDTKRASVPRGLSGVVGWMKEVSGESDCKDACVVYFHPGSDTSFAIGNPKDWQAEGNRMASDYLGKSTVFGHVKLVTKSKLREQKKRPGVKLEEEPEAKAQKV